MKEVKDEQVKTPKTNKTRRSPKKVNKAVESKVTKTVTLAADEERILKNLEKLTADIEATILEMEGDEPVVIEIKQKKSFWSTIKSWFKRK